MIVHIFYGKLEYSGGPKYVYQPVPCDTSLGRSTYYKIHEDSKKGLRSVKGDL